MLILQIWTLCVGVQLFTLSKEKKKKKIMGTKKCPAESCLCTVLTFVAAHRGNMQNSKMQVLIT